MNPDNLTAVLIMAVLVLLSAYFSATETAFSSLNRTRLKTIAEKGSRKANLALSLSENYDKLISTILIGNNIVNIALASLGTVLFVKLYGDMGATISTIVVTVAVLIFGEITPKSIAKDFPEKFAMFSAPFIRLLIWVLTPLNFIFSGWKKLLSKILKVEEDNKMSQEELLMLVEEVEQDGSIDTSEGDLLRNAIEFRDLKAEDILTHRVDLEAVSIDTPKEEIGNVFSNSGYSRLLVYRENIDDIVGVIHQKDFYVGTGITPLPVDQIITEPLFVHKFEKINDLLKQLQTEKSHIAVVVDEFGGTLGIVTMEDILEELVGDIWDEHDEIEEEFKKLDDDTYIVDCSVTLDDFCRFYDIESDSESVSLGGWVMEQMGKIPDENDSFQYENLTVTVTEADARRVYFVKVVKAAPAEEDGEDE